MMACDVALISCHVLPDYRADYHPKSNHLTLLTYHISIAEKPLSFCNSVKVERLVTLQLPRLYRIVKNIYHQHRHTDFTSYGWMDERV